MMYIYVDTLTLQENKKRNGLKPPIVVTGGGNLEAPKACCVVRISGPCEIIYDKKGVVFPGHEAHVVVVTEAEVEIIEGYQGGVLLPKV